MTPELSDYSAQLPADFHPAAHRLLRYWLDLCSGNKLPSRAAIDLPSIKYALGNIGLVDVLNDGNDFHYRLSGIELTRRDGYELTNKSVKDVRGPEYQARIRASFNEVITERRPIAARRDFILDRKRHCYDLVIVPLASDGEKVDKILYGQWHLTP